MAKLNYKQAGVDIDKGDLISQHAFDQLKKTLNSNSFAFQNIIGLKAKFPKFKDPYLAFAADGVGTKLMYTFLFKQSRNVGIDVVAMCVNDLVRNNITPLGFALYRATGTIQEKVMFEIAEGVTSACLESDCVYATGESAEMPGFYQKGEFDLGGFAVGVFDKTKLITGEGIKAGDIVVGLASSGIHSNGFSLVRKIFPPEKVKKDSTLYQQIITPTKIYVKSVLETNKKFKINGWAHITGSGLFGKLGKIIPDGLGVELKMGSWYIPNIFHDVQFKGGLTDREMFRTFNMGIGFVGVVSEKMVDQVVGFLKQKGEDVFIIGEVKTEKLKDKVTLIK